MSRLSLPKTEFIFVLLTLELVFPRMIKASYSSLFHEPVMLKALKEPVSDL
jgi:hypothetical protein